MATDATCEMNGGDAAASGTENVGAVTGGTGTRYPRMRQAAEVFAYDEVASTNDVARQIFESGHAPRRGMVVAQSQTAGRGRLGRQWVSREGESFIVSFMFRVPAALVADPQTRGWATMVPGIAVADAVREAVADAGLRWRGDQAACVKWPNDIVVAGRKLGGILTQFVELPAAGEEISGLDSGTVAGGGRALGTGGSAGASGAQVGLIYGVGLNLAMAADRLPTPESTSLQLVTEPADGAPDGGDGAADGESASAGVAEALASPAQLTDGIGALALTAMEDLLRDLAWSPAAAAAMLHARMERECWTLGRQVRATFVDGSTLEGTAVALGADASLEVRDADGLTHTVTTADVGVL